MWRSAGMKWLKLRFGNHLWAYRTIGNGMSRSGVPDDLLVIRGIFVGVEWKRPDYRPSKPWTAQDAEIEGIRTAGGRAAKVRNMDELEALVAGIEPVQFSMRG